MCQYLLAPLHALEASMLRVSDDILLAGGSWATPITGLRLEKRVLLSDLGIYSILDQPKGRHPPPMISTCTEPESASAGLRNMARGASPVANVPPSSGISLRLTVTIILLPLAGVSRWPPCACYFLRAGCGSE